MARSTACSTDDFISPHYRGPFTAYLLKGALMEKLIGQALAKSTGYSRGRSVAFTGPAGANAAPWVSGDLGTSLSVAVGAALSFSMDREGGSGAADRVSLVTFGDGTANRGDFHEAVNLASIWKLPVVFVCQNNCYAISQHVSSYIAGSSIAARAAGYGMPGVRYRWQRRVGGARSGSSGGDSGPGRRRSQPGGSPDIPSRRALGRRSGTLPLAGGGNRVAREGPTPSP